MLAQFLPLFLTLGLFACAAAGAAVRGIVLLRNGVQPAVGRPGRRPSLFGPEATAALEARIVRLTTPPASRS